MTQRLKLSDKDLLKELLHILRVKGDLDAISHLAIKEFGSLRSILAQRSEDLKRIKAFTPDIIKRLKIIYSLLRELIKPEIYPPDVPTFATLAYFLHTAPHYAGECIRLLLLDENHTILKDFIYKIGSGHHVKFYFREIVKEVLHNGVANLVIIHHKISHSLNPTSIDRNRYYEYSKGFESLEINLIDYLIVAGNSLYSLKNNQLYSPSTQIE
jgi:DNA repair protein RadC